MSVELHLNGGTRTVLLVGDMAFKFPKMRYGWSTFLRGLLANMQERAFSKTGWPELCPILFALPGGWLVVMKRARVMTDEEFDAFDLQTWADTSGGYIVPCEEKSDSYGWLEGRIVAIDYGN